MRALGHTGPNLVGPDRGGSAHRRPRGAGAGVRAWIARARRSAADALRALRADLARPARDRRVLHRLSQLSDRELRDIGLWRQDVRDATLPEIGDVSAFLCERREARRAAVLAFRARR